jgi:outer membrane lipoprotein-sorting protein
MRIDALLVLALAASPAAAQTPFGLAALMQSLASVPGATASFTEQRTSPLLSAPLTETGELVYRAPDYMSKTTLSPARQVFVLDHGRITMTGGPDGETHVFTQGQDPRIGGLVEAIRATLAGDLPALEALYTVQLTGSAAAWQMQLTPTSPALAAFVTRVTIDGTGNRVMLIDTQSPDGSESDMSISETHAP